MCDNDTERDTEQYLSNLKLTRRDFGALAAGASVAMMLPPVVNALSVVESNLDVPTPDGNSDCYFVHPAEGKFPGIILWPDILGLRPAYRTMGKRLAESGYSVLVVNPYYRMAKAPVVSEGASFQDEAVRNLVMPMYRAFTAETNVIDAKAYVAFLDQQAAVDTGRKIGTTGYCMSGPTTMRTAAAIPDRIGAGASFHGGGLVTADANSPHLLVPQMKASFLFAIAANDDEKEPEAKHALRKAYDGAGLAAEIEVYEGAMHGWCALDSRAYHHEQAERAWGRLLALLESSL